MEEVLKIIQTFSWPAACVALVFIAYKSGLINAFVSLLTKKQPKQLERMEEFMETAENNHYHELKELKQSYKEIWVAINGMKKDISDMRADLGGRISFLEGKLK